MINAKIIETKVNCSVFFHFKTVQSSVALTQRACSRYTVFFFSVEYVQKKSTACVEEIKLQFMLLSVITLMLSVTISLEKIIC